jgi:hypothetical protein
MNQYRCETCTFHTIPIDEIDRCKGEPITIGEFEAYQKRGCASHSDFQSERDTCPQNKIWQHCPVVGQIRKDERDTSILKELIEWSKKHERFDGVSIRAFIQTRRQQAGKP